MSVKVQIKIMKTILEYLKQRFEYRELIMQVMEEQRSQTGKNGANQKVAITGYSYHP